MRLPVLCEHWREAHGLVQGGGVCMIGRGGGKPSTGFCLLRCEDYQDSRPDADENRKSLAMLLFREQPFALTRNQVRSIIETGVANAAHYDQPGQREPCEDCVPEDQRLVRWLGQFWLGVPYPLRLKMPRAVKTQLIEEDGVVTSEVDPDDRPPDRHRFLPGLAVEELPGCGCHVMLKRLVQLVVLGPRGLRNQYRKQEAMIHGVTD